MVYSISRSYFLDEKISMPVVSIAVDPHDMFNSTDGLYGRCNAYELDSLCMAETELPVHVEYFEKGSSSIGADWQIDAGLSLTGRGSRLYPKKSVAIKMRDVYQGGRLEYGLFDNRPEANVFKSFNLRNSGNRYETDYIGDPALTSLAEGSSVDYQRYRFVVVFYNGEYYGIHDLRERLNEHYVETNYGIDSKEVDLVKHTDKVVTASGGTTTAYEQMMNFIGANDFSGSENEAYRELQSMMDIGNYADYMAMQIYLRNVDWPRNNVRAWRAPNQPFKFILYDVDFGYGWEYVFEDYLNSNGNMFDWIRNDRGLDLTSVGTFAHFYIKLYENPDFRRMFVNRASVMFSTFLTYNRVVDAVQNALHQIDEREMKRDMNSFSRDKERFDKYGEKILSYGKTRTTVVRDEYRKEFGLGSDIWVSLVAKEGGRILIDGVNLPSSHYKGCFFAGNKMLLEAVPDENRTFVSWNDGSRENPRLVLPDDGDSFEALFE